MTIVLNEAAAPHPTAEQFHRFLIEMTQGGPEGYALAVDVYRRAVRAGLKPRDFAELEVPAMDETGDEWDATDAEDGLGIDCDAAGVQLNTMLLNKPGADYVHNGAVDAGDRGTPREKLLRALGEAVAKWAAAKK